MKPPAGWPSLTEEWHNDTYPSIAPSNPALSAKDKTIVVTGGGRGIGVEVARAFAEAGAAHVALLGRTAGSLSKTQEVIQADYPETKVTTHSADVADEIAVKKVAGDVGAWDIMILNAGVNSRYCPIAEIGLNEWWSVLETNVKGAIVMLQAFYPTRRQNAAVIGINAALIQMPPSAEFNKGASAYGSSKIAQLKLLEHFGTENPDMFVASLHPGVVVTDMAAASSAIHEKVPLDKVQLPAHFLLWLTSPEAKFLNGRMVWTNWDVEQLKAKAKEIEASPQMLTSNVLGWPYHP